MRGRAHESRPASFYSKGRRRRAEGIPLRRGAPCGEAPLNAGSHSRLPAPFLGLWRECVRGTKGNRSASHQVVRRKRPLRRPFPGKRRESPLTAGGGARNISPCAADGRKRRGGALDAPGTLKTGYRGITDRNACGAPAGDEAGGDLRRETNSMRNPIPGSDHHSDGFFFILIRT